MDELLRPLRGSGAYAQLWYRQGVRGKKKRPERPVQQYLADEGRGPDFRERRGLVFDTPLDQRDKLRFSRDYPSGKCLKN